MKASRITVTVFAMVVAVCSAAPARAQSKIDFVKDFLARYRPAQVALPTAPAGSSQIADLIRSGQLQLSMGDLITLILQNNLDVGVDRLSPLSSQYVIETMYRPFEPTLHMQATVTRNTTAGTSALVGSANPSTLSGSYDIGYSQTLPTGTILGVDATLNRSSSNSSLNSLNPTWNAALRYSFTQHLLQNFGRATNLHSVRVAQLNQKISNTQFERQLIDLVAQAQRSYWDLVFSAEDIKVKQRSVDLAQKTLSDNQTQVRIGTLAPIDVVQAESDVATRQLQLVTSTYTERQTQDQVKKLITNQGDPGMVLAKLAPMQGVRRPEAADTLPVEEEIRIALENRPEMKQLQLDLQSKKLDVDYARNQLLPTVDFIAQYTQNGVAGTKVNNPNSFFGNPPVCGPGLAANVSCINPDLIGGLGTGLGQLFSYNYSGYSAGINIQIPLSNRAAKGEQARAQTDMHTTEQKLNSQAQQIALDVRNALTQVEMSKAQIEASTKARELAERRLEAEQKKFDLGASTIRFVLEEQRNVAQAQTDELQSLVSYTKALVELDRSTGMTLKKNNIEIEKTLNSGSTAR